MLCSIWFNIGYEAIIEWMWNKESIFVWDEIARGRGEEMDNELWLWSLANY